MIALGSVLRQLLRGGEVGPSACGLTALAPFGSAVLSLLTLQTRNSPRLQEVGCAEGRSSQEAP